MNSVIKQRWTKTQRNVVIAAYLGWTLDAFDFFLMVFMFKDISAELHSSMQIVATAVLLTLGMRPVGALLFGRIADRYGRKPALMWNILAYSLLEMASGFAPNMTTLLIVRALFGVAMGGEWGVGSALTMETIPASARGFVSGLLQSGYPTGYLLASLVVYLFYDRLGWRYMFVLGVIPAVLVFFIRQGIDESPAWREQQQVGREGLLSVLRRNWKLAVYGILLMTAFNFFSHGSQDAYPNLFLKVQHHFDTHLSSLISIVANLGAICGGLSFGFFCAKIGRRRAIIIAALARAARAAVLGLRVDARDSRSRCVFHANRRARCLGRDSRAPQRAIAAGDTRDVSRLHLPARQFARGQQLESAGRDRRGERQRLRLGDGDRGRHGRARDRRDGGVRSRAARGLDERSSVGERDHVFANATRPGGDLAQQSRPVIRK
jgi:MFS family permease